MPAELRLLLKLFPFIFIRIVLRVKIFAMWTRMRPAISTSLSPVSTALFFAACYFVHISSEHAPPYEFPASTISPEPAWGDMPLNGRGTGWMVVVGVLVGIAVALFMIFFLKLLPHSDSGRGE